MVDHAFLLAFANGSGALSQYHTHSINLKREVRSLERRSLVENSDLRSVGSITSEFLCFDFHDTRDVIVLPIKPFSLIRASKVQYLTPGHSLPKASWSILGILDRWQRMTQSIGDLSTKEPMMLDTRCRVMVSQLETHSSQQEIEKR